MTKSLKIALSLTILAVIFVSASAAEIESSKRQSENAKHREAASLQDDELKERQGSATAE